MVDLGQILCSEKCVHVDMKLEGFMGEYLKAEFVFLCFIYGCLPSPAMVKDLTNLQYVFIAKNVALSQVFR